MINLKTLRFVIFDTGVNEVVASVQAFYSLVVVGEGS